MNRKIILLALFIPIFGCKSTKSYLNEIDKQVVIPRIENYDSTNDENIYEGLTDREIDLKDKYSIMLKVRPEDITNYALYDIVDYWLNTPYKEGAFDKEKGLDCARFIQLAYDKVYDMQIPNTAGDIYKSTSQFELFVTRNYLEEGDIVFFRHSKKDPIVDIGMYLQNGRIVASTKRKGFNIYKMKQPYFEQSYIFSGRRIVEEDEYELDLNMDTGGEQ